LYERHDLVIINKNTHIYINQSLLTGKSDRYKGVYLINNQSQGMTTYHLSLFPCGHFFHFLGQGLLTGTTGTRASDWDKDF
jgi:hypothetical protein